MNIKTITANITPLAVFVLAKYGIESEAVSGVIEGICLIALALAPSIVAKFNVRKEE